MSESQTPAEKAGFMAPQQPPTISKLVEAPIVVPGLPPAEAGIQTTEFWMSVISGAVVSGLGLEAAFGPALSAGQRQAVLLAVGPSIALISAVYALGRSLRKQGTL